MTYDGYDKNIFHALGSVSARFFFFFFLFFRKKNILKELSFLKINHAMTNVSRKDGEHFTCDDIFAVLCMKKILFFLFQGTEGRLFE